MIVLPVPANTKSPNRLAPASTVLTETCVNFPTTQSCSTMAPELRMQPSPISAIGPTWA